MKKKIRKTGEIVDVIGFRADKGEERDWNDYVHYKTLDKLVTGINGLNLYQDFEDVEEELTKEIDWEQARIDAAIAAMKGILTNDELQSLAFDGRRDKNNRQIPIYLSEMAVVFADALIAELKKGGNNEAK